MEKFVRRGCNYLGLITLKLAPVYRLLCPKGDSLDMGEEICSRAEETNTQGGPLGGTRNKSTHTKDFYEGWISSYGDELAGEYKYSLALCPSLSAKISEEQSKKSMSHATLPQRPLNLALT
jgi:hypothetical protein